MACRSSLRCSDSGLGIPRSAAVCLSWVRVGQKILAIIGIELVVLSGSLTHEGSSGGWFCCKGMGRIRKESPGERIPGFDLGGGSFPCFG